MDTSNVNFPNNCFKTLQRYFSWWNPRFDSPILEEQYWMSTMLRTTRRFQFGLIYLLLLSLLTSIYFPAMQTPHWALFLCLSLGTLVTVSMTLGVTFSPIYQKHVWKISVALSLVSYNTFYFHLISSLISSFFYRQSKIYLSFLRFAQLVICAVLQTLSVGVMLSLNFLQFVSRI